MWEFTQVGEWKCQTCYRLNLKLWKHLLKHHGQWRVISAPSQAFQNSVTSGSCLDVCPYENGGQEQIGPRGISHSEAHKRENHALVYFLECFQNPIEDSGFVDELKFLGSKQQSIFVRTSAFGSTCPR